MKQQIVCSLGYESHCYNYCNQRFIGSTARWGHGDYCPVLCEGYRYEIPQLNHHLTQFYTSVQGSKSDLVTFQSTFQLYVTLLYSSTILHPRSLACCRMYTVHARHSLLELMSAFSRSINCYCTSIKPADIGLACHRTVCMVMYRRCVSACSLVLFFLHTGSYLDACSSSFAH